jgi:DNA-binding CsgD family transcriptional regulator
MRQYELFDPSEPRTLPQEPGAFFTINVLKGSRLRQMVCPLRRLADLVTAAAGSRDTYISQGIFAEPFRQVVHLAYATHAAVDLDTYNSPALLGLGTTDIVSMLLEHCYNNAIPLPSIILSSGRGYYAKWFWTEPIPRSEAGTATKVNRALVRGLAAFRADRAAVDMARVLRICRTINSKNERPVEIVYLAGTQDEPLTYRFDAFAAGLLPVMEEEIAAPPGHHHKRGVYPAAGQNRPARWGRESWHWSVLEDIRALAALRYARGIVPVGHRTVFAHLAACQLAHVVPVAALGREVRAITSTFLPSDFVASELPRTIATLMERLGGELVTFNGRKNQTPVYGYSKSRMMELLRVEPAEEREMRALISEGEKGRRHEVKRVARRRAEGVIKRSEYEAAAAARRGQVTELRGQGMSLRAIGRELGISPMEVHRLARGAREFDGDC